MSLKTAIAIARPCETVWNYFTEPCCWEKWWGGGLKGVSPGWCKGATLVWSLGGGSSIIGFEQGRGVTISGMWMDTTFRFIPHGTKSTTVEIEESDPKGGARFTDGGAANLRNLTTALGKLKACIEEETEECPVGQGSAKPAAGNDSDSPWWRFWKRP